MRHVSLCAVFFLQVSQWFELVVFTASMEIYGTAVADRLDCNRGMLNRRYYRQHCTLDFGSYTKDLSAISADLSSVFILDNSPGAYRAYPGNRFTWLHDPFGHRHAGGDDVKNIYIFFQTCLAFRLILCLTAN